MHSLYDISKSFEYNMAHGPFFDGEIPKRIWPDKKEWFSFLDSKVASKFGVSACAITTSKGIALLSRLGYDVLTYKTIRSNAWQAHPYPNITFVNQQTSIAIHDLENSLQSQTSNSSKNSLCIANSFGNASFDEEWTFNDIQAARRSIGVGQYLIVSIYGFGQTEAQMIQEFKDAAHLAQQAGAQAVEINLSCPNIFGKEAALYLDPKLVHKVINAVAKTISLPLLIKIGIFPTTKLLKTVLRSAARAGAQGVSAINTVPMKIITAKNRPTFNDRIKAGISGDPIRSLALTTIFNLHAINQQQKLDLTIIGIGGITLPEHIYQFIEAGATITQSATGALWNPYLAHEYHKKTMNQTFSKKKEAFYGKNYSK